MKDSYYDGKYSDRYFGLSHAPVSATQYAVAIHRTKSVAVPAIAVSLGLSYVVDRVTLGAGYRWERYFNAIDGGYAEHKSYDRTIDGPYMKVSIGFGG